jgi:XTP/dITP diphosphohydrolase
MHITIGTTNPYKVREIAALLEPTGASLTPCSMDIEEPGATFAENSYIKAAAYAKATGCMALAEDSGLVIPALKGLPGVYSARISDCNVSLEEGRVLSYIPTGRLREEIDQVNNEWVLKSLADVEQPYRAAYFEVVFTLVRPNGEVVFQTTGRYDGWIAEEARGTHGFGYDPIFVGNDTDGFTLAELDPGRKNLRSHRQRALSELAIWYGREMCPQQGESP